MKCPCTTPAEGIQTVTLVPLSPALRTTRLAAATSAGPPDSYGHVFR